MANTGTPALSGGSSYGPVRAYGLGSVSQVIASTAVGATYATGGNPIVLPAEISGRDLLAIEVLNPHDGTRTFSWDGSTAAPKLVIRTAFATELANATDTSAYVARILRFTFTG